jgi:hypothetical protein
MLSFVRHRGGVSSYTTSYAPSNGLGGAMSLDDTRSSVNGLKRSIEFIKNAELRK